MPCPLERVLDGESDLGSLGMLREPEVLSDRHDAAARVADERELAVVVDAAEALAAAAASTRLGEKNRK